ncbi:MAG: aminoacyl--tRNA ligase-related protein [Blastocatellia bacterium]
MNFEKLEGFRWLKNGQSSFSGKMLELYRNLDQFFLNWAGDAGATEFLFPTFIPARELARLDYFRSFPHLVTFPVTLDSDEENLKRFAEGEPMDSNETIHLSAQAPIKDALTPAACYHFYVQFQGESLDAPRYVTTRATCFRRESHYLPLERQWSFSMREIVCIGTADEVKTFLKEHQDKVDRFFKEVALSVEWKNATDPFFNPSSNPRYLLQKLDPIKTEMVYRTGLAIGSINFHRNYFGEAFNIYRDGKEAFSGCVAFGIERWMYAFLNQFGMNESDWPNLNSGNSK